MIYWLAFTAESIVAVSRKFVCDNLRTSSECSLSNDERTPFRAVWTSIFSSRDEASTTRLRALFPVEDDGHREWQFSPLHRAVLGLVSTDLEMSLTQHPADINLRDSTGKTALSWAAMRGDDAALGLL